MVNSACSSMLYKAKGFVKKYFLEGQKLEDKQKVALENLPEDAPLMTKLLIKHRRLVGDCSTISNASDF